MRLWARDLGCIRGGREVFAGVDFSLEGGETLAVTGPNGAGKTTLLRLIAGLLEPAGGRFDLEGGAPDTTLAEQAHYLGHRDALKPALTVRENLDFWYAYLGGGDAPAHVPATPAPVGFQARPLTHESCASALDRVGLAALARLPAAYLSAGQRRRLGLARLIAVPRPIWLLDEPHSALDLAGQQRLVELMRAHLAAGGMIVAATHGPLGLDGKALQLGARPTPPDKGSAQ